MLPCGRVSSTKKEVELFVNRSVPHDKGRNYNLVLEVFEPKLYSDLYRLLKATVCAPSATHSSFSIFLVFHSVTF